MIEKEVTAPSFFHFFSDVDPKKEIPENSEIEEDPEEKFDCDIEIG